MNYCMHKNDIVVGVRQGWFPESCAMNKVSCFHSIKTSPVARFQVKQS